MIVYDKTEWLTMQDDGSIPEGAPAINADNLNKIEDGIQICVDKINTHTEEIAFIKSLLQSDIVWENDSPDKTFLERTIEVDLSKYNRFSVLIKSYYTSDKYCEYTISNKDVKIFLKAGGYDSSDHDYGRLISVSNSGVQFSHGGYGGSFSSSYNSYSIPIRIIGYTY